MVCIYCSSETKTFNTRQQKRTNSVWRRRRCTACRAVFTSLEHADYERSLVIKNRESHIVSFQRDLLFLSIYEACKHRQDAPSAASALADTVIGKVVPKAKNSTIETADIIHETLAALKRFDKAAYVSYDAFHPV